MSIDYTQAENAPLSDEERAALRAFRAEYGREWKQYLMAAWLSYRYKGRHMGGEDTGILRQIRNVRGPSWLERLKPRDLDPPDGTFVKSVTVDEIFTSPTTWMNPRR